MRRIREILLSQYIGAIVIAFILAQAIAGAISGVVQPLAVYLANRGRQAEPSVFGGGRNNIAFDWSSSVVQLLSIALHVAVAYAFDALAVHGETNDRISRRNA